WDVSASGSSPQVQIRGFDGPAGATNDQPVALTISPDGQSLCYSTQNREVRVWNLAAGNVVYTFPAANPPALVCALAVDTYGGTVVGGCEDGTLVLWSVDPSRLLNDIP